MTRTTIVIGDDHPLVQAALRDALGKAMPEVAVVECLDLDSVMAAVAERPDDVDLVLLDLNMPGTNGFAGLFLMLAHHPTVPVAILSALQDSDTIRRALAYGASGYIPKSLSMAAMADAIRAILGGAVWAPPLGGLGSPEADEAEAARRFASLSPQQLRILTMIVDGKLNKQIAGELNVSEQTVKVHVSSILRKLNVVSRTQAAVVAGKLAVEGDILR
ncbi:DNA-binding NarL/FixJ family response regulator [Azospirillum agricola]|uniref:response regulator transcription factor n=1 Tax=Azospirillum agricola TaxID=1720247 RepID=UPI001AE5D1A0|nr:response regulator transcription factor [Azospirillum agricola]MBP2228573.1 DNA-binding NarL/FixJ family response regulator [Azospirillum agricola]